MPAVFAAELVNGFSADFVPHVKTFGEKVVEKLVEDGVLTRDQLEELLDQQKEGTRLLKSLTEKSHVSTFGEKVIEKLVEDGVLTRDQLEELLGQQKREGTRLLKLLVQKSWASEMDILVAIGRLLKVPPIDLSRVSVAPEVTNLLPLELIKRHKVFPLIWLEECQEGRTIFFPVFHGFSSGVVEWPAE